MRMTILHPLGLQMY